MSEVVVVAIRGGQDDSWSLLNICDPSDTGSSMRKAEMKAITMATAWQEVFPYETISVGRLPRSQANRCNPNPSLKGFQAKRTLTIED